MKFPVSKRVWIVAIWLTTLVWLQWDLLAKDPTLYRDDPEMLRPLHQVHSLADYISLVQRGEIRDIQPIRDFSVWINLQLPWPGFHLTNLILWLTSLFFLYQLGLKHGLQRKWLFPLVLLFGIHPGLLTAVFWVAARKHLLALLFILLATHFWIDSARGSKYRCVISVLFYVLAVFSQPIVVLWPLWALLFLEPWNLKAILKRPLLIFSTVALGLISLATLWLNYQHYTGVYLKQFGLEKFSSAVNQFPDLPFLSLGRHFCQLIFPWSLGLIYFPWSLYSLFGIAALGLFIFYCFRVLPKKEAALWLVWFFLPLAVVTFKQTNVFVSDCYLLVPAAGFLFLIVRILDTQVSVNKAHPGILALLLVVGVFFGWRSRGWADAYKSDIDLWEYAYIHADSPLTDLTYGQWLFFSGRYEESLKVGIKAKDWDLPQYGISELIADSVLNLPGKANSEKIGILKMHGIPGPETNHVLGLLSQGPYRN